MTRRGRAAEPSRVPTGPCNPANTRWLGPFDETCHKTFQFDARPLCASARSEAFLRFVDPANTGQRVGVSCGEGGAGWGVGGGAASGRRVGCLVWNLDTLRAGSMRQLQHRRRSIATRAARLRGAFQAGGGIESTLCSDAMGPTGLGSI